MFKMQFVLLLFIPHFFHANAKKDIMKTITLVTLVAVFLVSVSVHSHDCKRYKLTASDQLLIDMMQHYLHTSRKHECKVPNGQTDNGVVYTRWGRKQCGSSAELVYTGQVGGMMFNGQGGGVNKLCLPNDPENGQEYSYDNDVLYGSEYEIYDSTKTSGLSASLGNKEVPCAVCRRRQVSSVVMIPGRKTCYHGWNMEYNGYLMTEHRVHYRSDYSCVDMAAEALDDKTGNENGALFYPVKAKCGSLRCPPYKNGTEVYCVVCSK